MAQQHQQHQQHQQQHHHVGDVASSASMASPWRNFGHPGDATPASAAGAKSHFAFGGDALKRKRDNDVDDVDDVQRPNSAASCNNDGQFHIISCFFLQDSFRILSGFFQNSFGVLNKFFLYSFGILSGFF